MFSLPHSDWNTSTDEDSLPQLQQVSRAALACFLHHTGLLQRTLSSTKPKRVVVNIYRAVFAIRKEVFLHRPVANSQGEIDKKAVKHFQDICNMICYHLFFLLCVLGQAIPEEAQPIVPQIAGSSPAERQSSADNVTRSPGSTLRSGRFSFGRLFSQPADLEGTGGLPLHLESEEVRVNIQ